MAISAQRVRELDDRLPLVTLRAQLRQIDAQDVAWPDPSKARAKLVHLAADAQAGRRGEQRERGDDQAEAPAESGQAGKMRERRAAQEHDADLIREARRPAVLDRAFAEARLDDVEIEQARKAVAPAEPQPDGELRGEQRQDRPPPGHERDERERPDDRLVRPRRA